MLYFMVLFIYEIIDTFSKFDIRINLDGNFVNKFIKAKTALNDETSFTIVKICQ